MHKRKRRYFWLCVLIFVPFLCLTVIAQEEQEQTKEDNEDIFVFPSMQMEGVASASAKGHVPVVEVVYRGQPPTEEQIKSTTVSSREVITQTTKGKFLFRL